MALADQPIEAAATRLDRLSTDHGHGTNAIRVGIAVRDSEPCLKLSAAEYPAIAPPATSISGSRNAVRP